MKSNVSDHMELLHAVISDACSLCPAEVVPDLRDLKTLRARVEKEGLSFLTITLPSFVRDFERSLAEGCISPTYFREYGKTGRIPEFLQGIVGRIFDRETGRLLDEQSHQFPQLVSAVRQIGLLYKKVDAPCTPERERKALDNFVQVEQLNKEFSTAATERTFAQVADVLWTNMLRGIPRDMLIPQHGPGATAERILGNQKYVWQFWTERLERVFPFAENAYSLSAWADGDPCVKNVTFLQRDQEQPVRVVLVPKTLKSPRVIAIEPACMVYAQKAVQGALYSALETYWLTAGHVNFRDQSINQQLALTSSHDGRFATIDLSDASDRVLLTYAKLMFRSCPELWDLVEACRSDRAQLPDGRVIALTKFASMGSALCFPIEAMCFYTACVVALLESRNLPLTPRNVFLVTRDVYVYGDDLIVPVDEAGTVLDYLQKHNCKVNNSKTFLSGKFRESCGVDAYDGKEVTPTYLRHLRPKNRQQASELISWVATANLFASRGYWRTAELMFCTCERLLGKLPIVTGESPGLGRISLWEGLTTERWSPKLQTFLTRLWVPSLVYSSDCVDGYPALQKCLLNLERLSEARGQDTSELRPLLVTFSEFLAEGRFTSNDRRHLERTARRGAVTLKRRWVPVQ